MEGRFFFLRNYPIKNEAILHDRIFVGVKYTSNKNRFLSRRPFLSYNIFIALSKCCLSKIPCYGVSTKMFDALGLKKKTYSIYTHLLIGQRQQKHWTRKRVRFCHFFFLFINEDVRPERGRGRKKMQKEIKRTFFLWRMVKFEYPGHEISCHSCLWYFIVCFVETIWFGESFQ